MANINKIRISGTSYDIQDLNAPRTVELTQAEYDALVTAGTVSADTYYIITDAQGGDLSNYWTSAQTQSAINQAVSGKADSSDVYTKSETSGATEIATALSGKQDTLSAGTNITIVDNVISAEGGGGGKAIEAGRGISITTGATADTVSISLPISAGTRTDSLILGYYNSGDSYWNSKATGEGAIACGVNCVASGRESVAIGYSNTASGGNNYGNFAQGYLTTASGNRCHSEGFGTSSTADASHSEGHDTVASGNYSHSEGDNVNATNQCEHSQGRYNVSNKANTTFGDSGNTLFSVGNGTSNNARHNAFEIRQNGDIYLSSGGTDIKLQDHLGGGGGITSGEVQTMIDESISGKASQSDLEVVSGSVATKQDTLISGTNIKTINNQSLLGSGNIDIQGGGGGSSYTAGDGIDITNNVISVTGKQDTLSAGTNITIVDNVISATGGGSITIDPSLDSGSTNPVANSAITQNFYNYAKFLGNASDGYGVSVSFNEGTENYMGINLNKIKTTANGTSQISTASWCRISTINGKKVFSSNAANVSDFSLIETSAITTAITSSSTDAQVPSAKAVYDIVGDIETLLSQI